MSRTEYVAKRCATMEQERLFSFFRLMLLCVAACTMIGCQSKPTSIYVQKSELLNEKLSEPGKILFWCDVCVMHENDYFVLNISQEADAYMLTRVPEYLATKGYTMDATISPFVGGYKTKSDVFAVAMSDGSSPCDTEIPFFHDASLSNDEEYEDALRNLEWFVQFCFDKGHNRSARFSVNPHVKEWVEVIANRTGANTIILVNGHGECYSATKEQAKSFATGMATGLLTGGLVMVIPEAKSSHLDCYASVISTDDAEMLWSNSLRVKGSPKKKEFYYADRLPRMLFQPLPSQSPKK